MRTEDFKTLLDAAPTPCLVLGTDPDFVVAWANRAHLSLTGTRLADIVGRPVLDVSPTLPGFDATQSQACLRASLERVRRTQRLDALSVPQAPADHDAADGGSVTDRRSVDTVHVPVHDAAGRLRYILQQSGIGAAPPPARPPRDADAGSPLARVDAGLFPDARAPAPDAHGPAAQDSRLRALFEEAPSFVAILSGPQHVFELANRSFRELCGHRDLLQRPLRQALPELGPQGLTDLADRVYASGEAYLGRRATIRLPDSSGQLREHVLDFVCQPVFDDGVVSGLFVQGTDLTEQVRAQEELQHHRDRLEELVLSRTRALEESEDERLQAETALRHAQKMEAIGQLTGGVAHDFNNLLQVIGGNLQLLQRNVRIDEDQRRLRTAIDAVERGAKVASQLLAFARRQPLEPRGVHLGRLLEGMDDLLRRALGEAIELRIKVDPGLWITLTDPDQVENVVLNLAVNARDAIDGAGRVQVEACNVTLDRDSLQDAEDLAPGQYVMLALSDDGCGMDGTVLDKVFEPFFSTKPEGRGTGLGLSMVYGFVKQSGGHVRIRSKPGIGTAVSIYLPRSLLPEDSRPPIEDGPVEGGSETILVVEDDAQVQATVVDLLKGLGYRVLRASEAQSALAIAQSGVPIDLLFTDLVMPGPMRPTELARQVRELLPDMAILFTSGYAQGTLGGDRRLEAGVQLLSKPYRREDLARRVRLVLRAHQQERSLLAQGSPRMPYPSATTHPQDPPPPAPTPDAGDARPGPADRQDGARDRGLHILFVEDNAMIQMTTVEMLEFMGHRVSAHQNAESALAVFQKGSYDVLLSDIDLPGMSGVELAARLLAAEPGLRVVLASGYGKAQDAPLPEGDIQYLPKPYGMEEVERLFGTA